MIRHLVRQEVPLLETFDICYWHIIIIILSVFLVNRKIRKNNVSKEKHVMTKRQILQHCPKIKTKDIVLRYSYFSDFSVSIVRTGYCYETSSETVNN